MVSYSALSASLTALLEYLDLFQCYSILLPSHMHLSACYNNNSPHKLAFRFYMWAGDQKLRYDLVWPNCQCQKVSPKATQASGTSCIKVFFGEFEEIIQSWMHGVLLAKVEALGIGCHVSWGTQPVVYLRSCTLGVVLSLGSGSALVPSYLIIKHPL